MQLLCFGANDERMSVDLQEPLLHEAWRTWEKIQTTHSHIWRMAFIPVKSFDHIVFVGRAISTETFARTLAELSLKPELPVSRATRSTERDVVSRVLDEETDAAQTNEI